MKPQKMEVFENGKARYVNPCEISAISETPNCDWRKEKDIVAYNEWDAQYAHIELTALTAEGEKHERGVWDLDLFEEPITEYWNFDDKWIHLREEYKWSIRDLEKQGYKWRTALYRKAAGEEKPLPALIKKLADAIEEKGLKITFGIQPDHIKIIEEERDRMNAVKVTGFTEEQQKKVDMLYSEHLWEVVGKKIGWLPFTIALRYFRYLSKVTTVPAESIEQAFEIHPKLADCLLHAASYWKTDTRWTETLAEINNVISNYEKEKLEREIEINNNLKELKELALKLQQKITHGKINPLENIEKVAVDRYQHRQYEERIIAESAFMDGANHLIQQGYKSREEVGNIVKLLYASQQKMMDLIAYNQVPDSVCPTLNTLIDEIEQILTTEYAQKLKYPPLSNS